MASTSNAEVQWLTHRNDIQNRLFERTKKPGKLHDRDYVCYEDIEVAWSGDGVIRNALHPSIISSSQIEVVRKELLRFLSILVYIGAHSYLNDFHARTFDLNGKPYFKDSDLPIEEDKVPALGGDMLRRNFYREQYLFVPEIICDQDGVLRIDDPLKRLPFESVEHDINSGAYGTIDKVAISANYLRNQDGGTYTYPKAVACKRFHSRRKAADVVIRELNNLQILKTSLSNVKNIRLHIAILLQDEKHLILFPWAELYDLDIFLREGYRHSNDHRVYDFNKQFPHAGQTQLLKSVCSQMYDIAYALKWLHEGIIPQQAEPRTPIMFAHMDLKPDNILIDSDDHSSVGKWVLTDFGISAFKQDNEPGKRNYMSIRDFYLNEAKDSINTTPKRGPGPYQPPEVKLARGIDTKAGSAGRSSDIWSFGCILSEVLIFSLGKKGLLESFREARKEGYENDYFYDKTDNSSSYCVRPAIHTWLRNLTKKYCDLNEAIECCVEIIQKTLQVNKSTRPSANTLFKELEKLLEKLQGVSDHVVLPSALLEESTDNLSDHAPSVPRSTAECEPIGTENENLTGVANVYLPSIPLAHSAIAISSQLKPSEEQKPVTGSRVDAATFETPEMALQPLREPQMSTGDHGEDMRPSGSPGLHSATSVEQASETGRRAPRESQKTLHGVPLSPKGKIEVSGPKTLKVPKEVSEHEYVSGFLCPTGTRVTYLTKSRGKGKDWHYGLHSYLLSFDRELTSCDTYVKLPSQVSWKHLVTAGDYLVVWGSTTGGKQQVNITHNGANLIWKQPECVWLMKSFWKLAVSRKGTLVFVGGYEMHYVFVKPDIQDANPYGHKIVKSEDRLHNIAEAAFNTEGSVLYVWEYGIRHDRLRVWHIGGDNELEAEPFSIQKYRSEQQGEPQFCLTPYGAGYGCIIKAQNDAYFPSQIRCQATGSQKTVQKQITSINADAVCMYGDHSLLSVKLVKKLFKPRGIRIQEHRVVRGDMYDTIERTDDIPQGEADAPLWEVMQMRVVDIPNSSDVMIMMFSKKGVIVLLPVKAQDREV